MRFAYVDESGNNKGDRHTVVAGLVVHADDQMVKVENNLEQIIADFIPLRDRDDYFFRGSDIYGGNGYFKGKAGDDDEYPLGRRMGMLKRLAVLPAKHGLYIVHGHSDTRHYADDDDYQALSDADSVKAKWMLAHTVCIFGIERLFRERFKDEIAQVVVEDSDEMHVHIKNMDILMRHRRAVEFMQVEPDSGMAELLPLERIRGSAHFCEKSESRLLQLADVCAYLVRGNYVGSARHVELFQELAVCVMPPVFNFG